MLIARWIGDGLGSLLAYLLPLHILPALQCIFLPLNLTSVGLLNCVEFVGFKGFELGFSWAYGAMPDVVCMQTYFWLYICMCIYIFMGYAANLCDAGCSLLFVSVLFCFGFLWFCFGFWLKMN